MASELKDNILADPRYADFVEEYHARPLNFAVDVTGMIPSGDQESLLEEISPPMLRYLLFQVLLLGRRPVSVELQYGIYCVTRWLITMER